MNHGFHYDYHNQRRGSGDNCMSTYSNKSKTLPPALSNAGSARVSHRAPPAPKSVRSNQTRKSHRHVPSKMEVLQELSNVHSIDTSVGNKSKIPSPVDEATINNLKSKSRPGTTHVPSIVQERPEQEPSLRSELLTEVPDEQDPGADTKLSELRARLEALVTQGTGPALGSFGVAADHDGMGTARAPSIAPTLEATPKTVHGGPMSIKNYVPSIHQSHHAEIVEHSPEQPEHAHDHASEHADHVSVHHYHHVHDPPHGHSRAPSHAPSHLPSQAQTRAPSRMESQWDRSRAPSRHSHAPSHNHSHAPSHHHSRAPSHHHSHSHTNSHSQSHLPHEHSHEHSHAHSHGQHSHPSHHSHSRPQSPTHEHVVHHDHIIHDHDIPPHMAPYVTQEADRRRESSQMERELLEIVGTAEESENEMRKVISKLQRKLHDTVQSKEADEATLKSLQDALRDAESRGMALAQARKEAEIAAANETRRIEGYRYRDGERHRELAHAGDLIRQLQVDLDDAEEEVLFLRQKAHKADIVEAERRGRNQEREKRRKEKDKERERKALAAANAAVVSNPNGHKHNASRHYRTPSTTAPSTQTAPSPRTDTHGHSRSNSLYEPRRRPSQRNPYSHQHHQSQPFGTQHQQPPPMMDGHLQAGPYGPAGGASPHYSSPGANGPDQMSIHPPSTVPDPRLGPYRAPRPERAEGLQNFYEPPGWPRRPPTMTDGASVMPPPSIQPNGSPVMEPTHAPLGVVNQPSHPEDLNLGHSDGNYYRRRSHSYQGTEPGRNAVEPVHPHAAGGGPTGPAYNPVIVEPGQEEARVQAQNEMGAGSALGLNGGIHRQQTPIPPGGLGGGGLSRGATPVPEISLQPPSLKGTPAPPAHMHAPPPHLEPSGVPLPESVYGGSNYTHHTHHTHSHPQHHAYQHSHHHNPSMQSFADPSGVPLPHSRPGSSMYHHPHVGSVGTGLGIQRAPSVMHTPTGHARNVPLPDSVLGSPRMSDATAYRGMPPIQEMSRPPSMMGMHGAGAPGMQGMPFARSPSMRSNHIPPPAGPHEVHPLSQAAAGEAHMAQPPPPL
ncbi:hypothetical protein E3P99_00632 [Wallemia hederae]|uniref:Uncharacterized protein n=1 Tax=Wallemia hederae TaxID=1540922 RepID=A0A4T0FZ20_9BASI|nr:hypothetical protein E3P99_00632 [Wallemia hederae]